MFTEIVTPAGRKRYLELLFEHLKRQKEDFDQWSLWLNTNNQDDIGYCKQLEQENNWIKTYDLEVELQSFYSIWSFFKHACNPERVYIRLDDDVVWLESGFIKKLKEFRIQNPEYFLVFGNIVNNALIDHLHQRAGALKIEEQISYNCLCEVGWRNPFVAEKKHDCFLNAIKNNSIDQYRIENHIVSNFDRVSINCISWLGKEFALFNGAVDVDEEKWLTEIKPREINKPNIIFGNALCAHYAFTEQRGYLDDRTNILCRYKELLTIN